jgi:hypothetical protein
VQFGSQSSSEPAPNGATPEAVYVRPAVEPRGAVQEPGKGRPAHPELGLRRVERGERRVDFDDLLALAYVLKVCVVDLMVSRDAADEPYSVVP